MTALVSIVPLETLSGWPAATDPSVLQLLGLLVGLPLLAIVVALAVAKLGNSVQANRPHDGVGDGSVLAAGSGYEARAIEARRG